MLVPPVVIGSVVIGCIARLMYKSSLSRIALMESALPLIVRLLFLLYPLIANIACASSTDSNPRFWITAFPIRGSK